MIFRIQKGDENFDDFSCCFFPVLLRFWLHFGPHAPPKIEYFSSKFALGVALGPSWRHEGAQSPARQLQRSIFQEFGTIFGLILEGILKIFDLLFDRISSLISHRMFTALLEFAAPC